MPGRRGALILSGYERLIDGDNAFTAYATTMHDTLCLCSLHGYACAMERKVLGSEVWQFLVVLLGFVVVAVVWMFVVYLPGRTLERWKDQRFGRSEGKTTSPAGPGSPEGPLESES